MTIEEFTKTLRELRELAAWNDIAGIDLTDSTRDKIMVDIDDIIEGIKENGEDY